MCEFFVKADPILYESRSRTVRIHGVLTSIRLENLVWDTLSEMASDEGCTTNHLIAQFHDEILQHRGDVANFSSFLRVTCLRYLRRKCDRALGVDGESERALALPQKATPSVVTLKPQRH
jgi:predicted DNA-binding ribbon-helix-helix protein